LPDNIERPFTNFAVPLIVTGHVPHHVGEWFGWDSITLWYVACAALLLAPIVAALWRYRGVTPRRHLVTVGAFVIALGIGMIPAFSRPPVEGNPFHARIPQAKSFFTLHHSALGFVPGWEPPGRDRVTTLRHEAERYGTRGRGPCLWHRVAAYERLLGMEDAARRDEARAGSVRAEQCPKTIF
jgi:hypothetical protein